MSTTPTELETLNYDLAFLRKPRWILAIFFIILVSIFMNFSFEKKIDSLIYGALSSNSRCPIGIDSYAVNLFPLPHLEIVNMTIPNRCLGAGLGATSIPLSKAYFRGPSLFPLGVSFKIETEFNKNPINLYTTAGFGHYVFELKENKLSLDKLSPFIPKITLAGEVLADIHVEIEDSNLTVLNVKLQSDSFVFPSQEIESFLIKRMNIKNLFLTAVTEGNKVKITQLIVGNEDSPIRADFKGSVNLNNRNMRASTLDLKGELAFSKEMLDEMFLIKNYMNQFDQKDNFYQLKVQGPLTRPILSSNRQ